MLPIYKCFSRPHHLPLTGAPHSGLRVPVLSLSLSRGLAAASARSCRSGPWKITHIHKNTWQQDADSVEKIRAMSIRTPSVYVGRVKGIPEGRAPRTLFALGRQMSAPSPSASCFLKLMTNMSPSEALSKGLLRLCRSLSPIWASLGARGRGCRRKLRWLKCSWAPGGGLVPSLSFLSAAQRGPPEGWAQRSEIFQEAGRMGSSLATIPFPGHSSPTKTSQGGSTFASLARLPLTIS